MVTVQVQTEVSLTELLQGVQKLDTPTLEQFADEVMLLRAKRRVMNLPKDEATLLRQINQGLPEGTRKRLAELKAKREAEILTPSEHEDLVTIVDQIEWSDVLRLQALTDLAQLRNVSVRDLVNQFSLNSADEV
ncbi:MAG: hypothetical protein GY759_19150 [Chloroflexi bacterium]|nr:hypothetical protein [Chloroflexota bacterium]